MRAAVTLTPTPLPEGEGLQRGAARLTIAFVSTPVSAP